MRRWPGPVRLCPREDPVRGVGRLRPRRVRCVGCRVTHVLLSVSCLWRRADAVELIGAALQAKAAGAEHRPIAARLDRPVSTVRGWLSAFARNAETVRSVLSLVLAELDPLHGPTRPQGDGRPGESGAAQGNPTPPG